LFDGIPSSSSASHDTHLNRFWGVDKPATVAVPAVGEIERTILKFKRGDDLYELQRHPFLYLTADISAWFDQYSILEFGRLDIERVNVLFIDAMRIFKFYNNKFIQVNK
jgi:hypothetical protein